MDASLSDLCGKPLNNFRCGVHPVESFSRDCELELRKHEKDLELEPPTPKIYVKGAESLTHALIRKTGDLFHNDQTGVYKLLTCHLKDLHPETKKTHLYQRFVGNRFNCSSMLRPFFITRTGLFLSLGITFLQILMTCSAPCLQR